MGTGSVTTTGWNFFLSTLGRVGDIHFSSGNAPSFLALSGSFSREDGQENALSKKLPLSRSFRLS